MKQVFCAVFTLFLLSLGAAPMADEAGFVVGMSTTLSGANARSGQEQLRGLSLWAEEINARGGLAGRKVVIKQYDDGGDAEICARFYEKLVGEDNAAVLVGPYSSEATLAVAAVAEKTGVPIIAPGIVTKAAWAQGTKHNFELYVPAGNYMDQILAFAKTKGLRRIALIYQNSTFPREMADGVRARATALGLRIVLDEEYDRNSTDFSAVIAKLKFKRPDAILVGAFLPDSVAFMRQMKESKLSSKIIAFGAGPNVPEFGKVLGADAEGVWSATQWEPALRMAGGIEFVRKYKTKFGHDPGYHAAGGYAAGQMIEAAAKRAGGVEREQLRKALSEIDVMTVLGRYKVDVLGRQTGRAAYLTQWIKGERVVVLPSDVAASAPVYPFSPWGKR